MSIILIVIMSSCFTGVERTDTIKLSKSDKEIRKKIIETEMVVNVVKPQPLQDWIPGKRFYLATDRINILFNNIDSINLSSKIIRYIRYITNEMPDGSNRTRLIFEDESHHILEHIVERNPNNEILSDALPMMIDMDMVATVDSILKGRKLWTLTANWEEMTGTPTSGVKFVPITVTASTPGNSTSLPIKIHFITADSVCANIPVAINTNNLSRAFTSQFSLFDPRRNHENIPINIWNNIQHCKVVPGMTKEQCRLALGDPMDVDSSHDWSNTYDLWIYPGGRCLRFHDSILTEN